MRLLDKKTKMLMEECKSRARDFGLNFPDDTLEYIVSNQDLIELSPKIMIPTMYDHWLHDVGIHAGKGKYEFYPSNPMETVINSFPPISFYNNDNPDWMNKFIFYHVLGHIDFFQSNDFFQHTWSDDICGRALSHKRRINTIKREMGAEKRWVDYVIEFTRQLDNLVNMYKKLRNLDSPKKKKSKIDYYFSEFMIERELGSNQYFKEIDEYNQILKEHGEKTALVTFIENKKKDYPEFESWYKKYLEREDKVDDDIIDFLMKNSDIVNKSGNEWMKDVMQIVKETSEYLEPQRHTKIINEGWACLVHDRLFITDRHLSTHEADYAKINASVTQIPKVGLNPYAIGQDLLLYIEELGDKGKLGYEFEKNKGYVERKEYDDNSKKGLETLFNARKRLDDFHLVNFLDDTNFQEFVNHHKLYVTGKKLNPNTWKWEYYIKSRNGKDYRDMLINQLPHPPKISYSVGETGKLNMEHVFEGKQLHKPFIENVLRGTQYIWGKTVTLETVEFIMDNREYQKWLMGEENVDYDKKIVRHEVDESGKYYANEIKRGV